MACELLKVGCHFTGMVKTAHCWFPKDFIQKAAFNATSKQGNLVVLTALKDWTRLIAVGWRVGSVYLNEFSELLIAVGWNEPQTVVSLCQQSPGSIRDGF